MKEGDPLWPAQLAVALAISLHLALSDKLVIGPKWLIPSVEGLLLLTLILVAPRRASRVKWRHQRRLLWTILGLVTLTYLVSLGLLVHFLIVGGKTGGDALIGSGVVLWVTNVLLFSVIYWDLDRGGPLNRHEKMREPWPDFLFPQMDSSDAHAVGQGVATDVSRLPLYVAHECHRLQPHRHDADHADREAPDGGSGDVGHRDPGPGRRTGGQHPRLTAAATPGSPGAGRPPRGR